MNWRKSTRSQNTTNCVEVGCVAGGAAVRDTKDRAAGYLAVPAQHWGRFVAGVKAGRFDG
ncbi:DUF397 domain-containing protein [Saccharopolyspora erythraea]|uniref:DUF397 domain-containing protein n=1 Tax=Saccharopolyspora erythraea TaxID=1836 RepID=UPI003D801FEE